MLSKLIINGNSKNAEFISDFLLEHGALSVTFEDGGSQALFQEHLDETPLWRQTQIHALFEEDAPLDFIIQNLAATQHGPVDYQINRVDEDQDWVQITQRNFPAQLFANRLWIAPSWEDGGHAPGPECAQLRLNPGLGFGTGAHPTTALCLNWLAQQDCVGKTVIDYGCGSGILGLAALSLGAEKVWAVDYDPQALTATQNNALLNDFSSPQLNIVLPQDLPPLRAEVILANILANPLCELALTLTNHLAPSGYLVLSGFFTEEVEKISQIYQPLLHLQAMESQENWVMMVYKKI